MSDTITISRQDYQDLIDGKAHAEAMRAVASGAMETFTDAEADAYLAAPSALAFWRKRRGMTQAHLAAAAGITQPYLAQIERLKRNADVRVYVKLAQALNTTVDNIVPDA